MGKARAKREQAGFNKISNFFMSFDYFGEPAKLKVKGTNTLPSFCGTVLSFIILLFCTVYAVNKYNTMKEYGDTSY